MEFPRLPSVLKPCGGAIENSGHRFTFGWVWNVGLDCLVSTQLVENKQWLLSYKPSATSGSVCYAWFHSALPTPLIATSRCPPAFVWWFSPPKSLVKVNYDGATFQDLQKAGIGVAIRNHVGLVLAYMTDMVTLPPSIDTVECLAAVRALHFASDCGFSFVILEGDSKIVYSSQLWRCISPCLVIC